MARTLTSWYFKGCSPVTLILAGLVLKSFTHTHPDHYSKKRMKQISKTRYSLNVILSANYIYQHEDYRGIKYEIIALSILRFAAS
ncbi:MAG: hypothetical protein K9J17_17615 [Flavobacteriales bacterium]|nr:hypothetical protein [Flavobacteriales bacterium]